jgi:hypothetical protein
VVARAKKGFKAMNDIADLEDFGKRIEGAGSSAGCWRRRSEGDSR